MTDPSRNPLDLTWSWAWPHQWDPGYALHVAALTPLFVAMIIAAVIDCRVRKIPNWLTFSLAAAGLLRSFVTIPGGLEFTPLHAFGGLLVGLLAGVPLFILGARGAGDVKLYAAAGAWLGPAGVIALMMLEAIIGMIGIVARATARGELLILLKNTGVLIATLIHVKSLGTEQAADNGRRFTSISKPLPHAVPALAAIVLAAMQGRL